jgi:hypothetical protein
VLEGSEEKAHDQRENVTSIKYGVTGDPRIKVKWGIEMPVE